MNADPPTSPRAAALQRCSVNAAQAWVSQQATPLESESIPLAAAANRVLAADIVCSRNVPHFPRAMMDGFALQASDTQQASLALPAALQIVGEAFPGRAWVGSLQMGQALRITTGAPLPNGADAVVPIEQTQVAHDRVLIQQPLEAGKHVAPIGEDFRAGSVALPTGRALRPFDLGALAALGIAEVEVVRQPRVRLLITGNELLPAGTVPQGEQIVDANGPMLQALVTRDGGLVRFPGILPDDPDQIAAALHDDADVILVSGGSSAGQADFAPQLLAKHGELAIHGVAMRPGHPTCLGRIGARLVFILPGNPVACWCAYDLFAGRAVRLLGGQKAEWPYRAVKLPLAAPLPSVLGRTDYARVQIVNEQIVPLQIAGAAMLSSLTRADGFVIVPHDCPGYAVGEEAVVWLY